MNVRRSSARAQVVRSALIFTPVLAVAAAAWVFILRDALNDGASPGRIVGLVLVGFVVLLVGYQVVQSVRDLFARPVETTGVVERRWSRSEFMLFRNAYVFVGRDVYRLEPEELIQVDLGDTVRIVHYPHTSVVESIEVVARAGEQQGERDG